MWRVAVGVVSGAVGVAVYVWSRQHWLGLAVAIGTYAVIDRTGWIPGPYRSGDDSPLNPRR